MNEISQLTEKIDLLSRSQERVIISLDGRSASGKTTLAQELAQKYDASVIHMDDFFLPPGLRTPERYLAPGANVHYERFIEEVLTPLKENRRCFRYHIFNCADFSLFRLSPPIHGKIIIVEGAYSRNPIFGNPYDIKVFCDIPYDVQTERIRIRNGEEKLRMFTEKWIPLEEKYFSEYNIKASADFVLLMNN